MKWFQKAAPCLATLRSRLLLQSGLMIVGALVIGLIAVSQVNGLHEDFGVAMQGYRQLRQVYEIGLGLTLARQALEEPSPRPDKASLLLQSTVNKLRLPPQFEDFGVNASWLNESQRADCISRLQQLMRQVDSTSTANQGAIDSSVSAINSLIGQLASLSRDVRHAVLASQQAADAKQRQTRATVAGYCLVMSALAIFIGVWHYGSVMKPLQRLGSGVRSFAAGELASRIEPAGDREFAQLAADFNHMAGQLEDLCKNLQQQVQLKSQELVRSERLASVGYLAAGVAHEINNPLGIISGYSERSLRLLDREPDASTGPKLRQAAEIICEETFRCKKITDRLLALARPGDTSLSPVSLPAIATEVVTNLGGLPNYADRRITIHSNPSCDLTIMARSSEISQVILNLVVNALEASPPATGHVQLAVGRKNDMVELTVHDNGRGMTPQTLARIFEPFFSQKTMQQVAGHTQQVAGPGNQRAIDSQPHASDSQQNTSHGLQNTGQSQHGTGLGLSITHAIVLDHGGSIHASSQGIGRGSCFVVQFPAANKGMDHAS